MQGADHSPFRHTHNFVPDFSGAERRTRTTTALISPGFRYAFNCPNDLQIVAGAATPIGITSDSPDWGLFFYLSFEYPFVRPRDQM
jgi:hypothetical protein